LNEVEVDFKVVEPVAAAGTSGWYGRVWYGTVMEPYHIPVYFNGMVIHGMAPYLVLVWHQYLENNI
jgi:hypothetical protein